MAHSSLKPLVYYLSMDFHPDRNAGAARANDIVECLSEFAQVKVMTNKYGRPIGQETVHSLPIKNSQNQKNLFLRFLREFLFCTIVFVRLLFSEAKSIIVVTSPPFLLISLLSFLPKKKGQLFVLDVRDIYPDIFVHAGLITPSSFAFRALSAIESAAYRKSDVIFTVCESLANKIRRRSPGSEVKLVLNGYSDHFNIQGNKREPVEKKEKLSVITHGNFGRFQDVEVMNELTKKVSHLPIKFTFMGFGAKFGSIVPRPNVEILPAVANSEIPEVLSQMDLGLSCRTSDEIGREAIPVKVLEYLGVGLPSLVFPIMEEFSELEQKGAICQFEGDDLDEAVKFLEEILCCPEKLSKMIETVMKVRNAYSRKSHSVMAVEYLMESYRQKLKE